MGWALYGCWLHGKQGCCGMGGGSAGLGSSARCSCGLCSVSVSAISAHMYYVSWTAVPRAPCAHSTGLTTTSYSGRRAGFSSAAPATDTAVKRVRWCSVPLPTLVPKQAGVVRRGRGPVQGCLGSEHRQRTGQGAGPRAACLLVQLLVQAAAGALAPRQRTWRWQRTRNRWRSAWPSPSGSAGGRASGLGDGRASGLRD